MQTSRVAEYLRRAFSRTARRGSTIATMARRLEVPLATPPDHERARAIAETPNSPGIATRTYRWTGVSSGLPLGRVLPTPWCPVIMTPSPSEIAPNHGGCCLCRYWSRTSHSLSAQRDSGPWELSPGSHLLVFDLPENLRHDHFADTHWYLSGSLRANNCQQCSTGKPPSQRTIAPAAPICQKLIGGTSLQLAGM